jgi:hypothetical protein
MISVHKREEIFITMRVQRVEGQSAERRVHSDLEDKDQELKDK